jgi:nicotinamidase-related amidase
LNQNLLNTLNKYDRVFLLGEAANVCVKNSLNDLNTYAPDLVKKLVILTDCMSPIGNFDPNTDDVFQKAVSLGAKLMKSTEVTF